MYMSTTGHLLRLPPQREGRRGALQHQVRGLLESCLNAGRIAHPSNARPYFG